MIIVGLHDSSYIKSYDNSLNSKTVIVSDADLIDIIKVRSFYLLI